METGFFSRLFGSTLGLLVILLTLLVGFIPLYFAYKLYGFSGVILSSFFPGLSHIWLFFAVGLKYGFFTIMHLLTYAWLAFGLIATSLDILEERKFK